MGDRKERYPLGSGAIQGVRRIYEKAVAVGTCINIGDTSLRLRRCDRYRYADAGRFAFTRHFAKRCRLNISNCFAKRDADRIRTGYGHTG